MWLLFLFLLLQLIQCSVNPIKQILSPPKKQQFSRWIYANKIFNAYFSKQCVIKPHCDYTRNHEASNWKKEHGCLHRFVSEMICSAPLTSLLLWKSGCASLGLESCSSRGVITALFTLGSVCHTGQFFSHWGVWGGLWDKQTASYTARNKPLIMQGFVILTFFLH